MKFLFKLKRLSRILFSPVGNNAAFFIFMYTLGIVCTYAVVPDKRGYHAWVNAPFELFTDITLLCVLLRLLPRGISRWIKRAFYVTAYLSAVTDVYCFVKFDTTITPTMLLLVGETNGDEAAEFLSSYITPDLMFSRLGFVLLLILIHAAWAWTWNCRRIAVRKKRTVLRRLAAANAVYRKAEPWICVIFISMFVYSSARCIDNKRAFLRLMSQKNIGSVEHELTRKDKAVQYMPLHRLVFSIYANRLTAKQVKKLINNIENVTVDSCSYRSPNIVLIIGESYNRHHSGLYGYDQNTTPLQKKRARSRQLTPFSDVVSSWNLTSFVFKHLFSLYTVGDKGEWCDYPLFPEVFRKAGYHVTFLTNQFLQEAKEAVYDFSGGFFLNNSRLDKAMFDTRNTKLFHYDAGLVSNYDEIKPDGKPYNLTIFHLKGQHVDYRTRFPHDRHHFKPDDYNRPDLKPKELRILADYDNAVLYNDSITDAIIRRFEKQDAIVIYVPDHGEECYGEGVHFYGRMHSTEITARLAREEFDIPFWIWCSKKYIAARPQVFRAIRKAGNRPYMTDALPHLLLWLAGIDTPYYRDSLNILSPHYNSGRPRMLKNTVDYNLLKTREQVPCKKQRHFQRHKRYQTNEQ